MKSFVPTFFISYCLLVSGSYAQDLRVLVPAGPAAGINAASARQLLPEASLQASTPRSFAANHAQLMKQSDAVLLTTEGINEYQLENGKLTDSFDLLSTVALKPLALWSTAAASGRARAFANLEVAVPNDATGREGKCTELLTKYGKAIRVQRYAKLQSALADLKGGHLAAVCAPYVDPKDSSIQLIFASASYDAANGERVNTFPGVPAAYLDAFNEVLAVYVPKSTEKSVRARLTEMLEKNKAALAKSDAMAGWAIAR